MERRRGWRVVAAFIACLAMTSTTISEAALPAANEPKAEKLTVRVTPLVVLAPTNARGLVRVPRHADNRLLRVVLESENYYSSSDIELQGADAAQTHLFNWRALPPGSYRVRVEIYGPAGLRDSTQAGALVR